MSLLHTPSRADYNLLILRYGSQSPFGGSQYNIYLFNNAQTAIKQSGNFDGKILGNEDVGTAVQNFKKGDKVIISCISRCGTCENCQKQLYAHCMNNGGWIIGYMIDGTQAEYVRTPYADTSLYLLPDELNDDVTVLLSDALPTAHEIGVLNGDIKQGNTIAIVGAGPVGMGCLLTAQLYSPSQIIMSDMDENRLSMAKEVGQRIPSIPHGRMQLTGFWN